MSYLANNYNRRKISFKRGKGSYLYSTNGEKYLDFSIMGVGTNILGYGHEEVDSAVNQVINSGNMSTLNCPEEVTLAENLIKIHPWFNMVKFAKTGGEANAIEAEKRMLSSMSPTLILDENGDIFMVAGSPGGSRIITATLQAILNVIDHEMNIAEAVSEARFHNLGLPDAIYFEEGLNLDSIRILESMGYTLRQRTRVGNVNAIVKKGEYLYGAADPRALAGSAKGF